MPGIGGRTGLRFGVVADPQYCDCDPKIGRHYRETPRKLAACVQMLNRMDLDFVINLGDFIDRDFASFDVLLPIWQRLRHPAFHVLGNHDYKVAEELKSAVPAKLGMVETHYTFGQAGWRFVVLDGNELSTHPYRRCSPEFATAQARLQAVSAQNLPQNKNFNGALGDPQLVWLAGILQTATANGERVVVFCHYPAFPADPHNLWDDQSVTDLLGRFDCVAAYMSGHNHAGNYGLKNGVHYVNFKGMVETEADTAFATVSCFADRLEITGYGLEADRNLSLNFS